MTGDRQQAEIYTQDTFVNAWQHLKSFRQNSAFSTWLHRIAVNAVLSSRRSNRRRFARIQTTDDLSRLNHSIDPPSHASALDLDRCICELPEKARAVLILHDLQGYKHAEIGEMMEIAPGTSKAHLHRARKILKEMLTERYRHDE